jgi:hypothetical protein
MFQVVRENRMPASYDRHARKRQAIRTRREQNPLETA